MLGYRASLDGVRALAVLFVAGVHTRPRLVPGGSIGVDMFFVLSGFLITTLLVEELDSRDRIAVGRFYVRRALRLLPALFGLLSVICAWALFVAAPDTRRRALQEVLAAASYTRNFTWWTHVPGPLLGHTWSLALEEQFYLIWPALLAVCLRPRRPATRLIVTFTGCFIAVTILRRAHIVGPGLLFIQRPEALLLGAALALARRQHGHRWAGVVVTRRAAIATVLATAGLIATASWDGADSFYSVGYTVAALCTAALIFGLVVLHEQGPARLFACRPAVALGRISYGFYLWHMPVLRWTDDRLVGKPAAVRISIGLSLAFAATLLSYRFLEQPALRLKQRFAPSNRPVDLAAHDTPASPSARS